jgi:hypothetical protein
MGYDEMKDQLKLGVHLNPRTFQKVLSISASMMESEGGSTKRMTSFQVLTTPVRRYDAKTKERS